MSKLYSKGVLLFGMAYGFMAGVLMSVAVGVFL